MPTLVISSGLALIVLGMAVWTCAFGTSERSQMSTATAIVSTEALAAPEPDELEHISVAPKRPLALPERKTAPGSEPSSIESPAQVAAVPTLRPPRVPLAGWERAEKWRQKPTSEESALGGHLQGRVLAPDGGSIPNDSLQVFAIEAEGVMSLRYEAISPAGDGSFSTKELLPGPSLITFGGSWISDWAWHVDIEDGAATVVELVIDPPARLSGRVTWLGLPVDQAGVSVQRSGDSKHVKTDADGEFEYASRVAGSCRVQASLEGGGRSPVHLLQLAAGDPQRCEIAFSPLSLEGRVVDRASGAPVFQANVGFRRPVDSEGGEHRPHFHRATDERGSFAAQRLLPGEWHLSVGAAGFAHAPVRIVTLSDQQAAGDSPVVLELDREAVLQGVVKFQPTDLVRSSLVAFCFDADDSRRGWGWGWVADDGSFRLERLPAGEKLLIVASQRWPHGSHSTVSFRESHPHSIRNVTLLSGQQTFVELSWPEIVPPP